MVKGKGKGKETKRKRERRENLTCVFVIKKKHLPAHVVPSPAYPELQAHVKLPAVLVQAALESQLFEPEAAHSSTSAKKVKYNE